jgi:hypothetical protein
VLLTMAAALATPAAAPAAQSLRVVRDVTSATGRHVWYQQMVDGLPLLGERIYVNEGGLAASAARRAATAAWPATLSGSFRVTPARARTVALRAVGAPGGASARAVPVAVRAGRGAVRAWAVRVVVAGAPHDHQVVVDGATGRVLSARNDVRMATGIGRVFAPNPLVTLRRRVRDAGDRDQRVLAPAYFVRRLHNLDGSGLLRGRWVDTSRHSRATAVAREPDLRFLYRRANDRFESVMAYHYLDRTQAYVQSLGFGTVLPAVNRERQQVAVDTYTGDNSFYQPSIDLITLGTGGVDDGEDPDVILHEYGHAIQDAQVPGFGRSLEAGAMGEGFGDYWAGDQTARVTLTRPTGHPGADVECVADWDSISYSPPPACLRRLDSAKRYPRDVEREVHADGEMWSASLWTLRANLGRRVTNRIVLESHFSLNPGSSFADGARAVIAADRALYAGRHVALIRGVFRARGFLR